MRPSPDRRRPITPRLGAAALLALGGLACSDGPLDGPALPGRGVSLRLAPRVEPRASVVAADIAKVRVAIVRVPDGLVVLDSVVSLVGSAGAELNLAVPLASSSDRFAVHLAAADAAGDTIFRAVDTTDVVRGPATPSLELMLRYAGPDTGLARIVAGPDTTVVDAGASVPLWAVGYRPGAGDATPLAHVSWRSGDETVVRVSRTGGRATAIAPGRAAWVYATTVTGLVDSARVVVRHVLAALEPSPASLALRTGASARVTVAGRASDGAPIAAEAVTWTSSDSTVAVVDAEGGVTALRTGFATITASAGTAQVAIPVVVQLPAVAEVRVAPATVSLVRTARARLAATVTLETGSVATDRPPTWTTSNASVATVDADGMVTAVGVGGATITAAAGGRSASAAVSVVALPANAIVASPATVHIIAGESLMLAATVTDAAGEPVPNTVVGWTSASPAVATVSSAGILTAVVPGTTTVTASANGRADAIAVTVLPVPVDSILLSTSKLPLVVGTATRVDATPVAANGTPLPDRAVTWSSSAPSVATVDANGGIVAVAVGRAHVTATSEGRSTTIKVDVVPVPAARVALSATTLSLLAGGTYQLRADAYDSLGRLLPGRIATWSPSDPSVAMVASDGLVTAKKAGQVTITASVDGKTATAAVTVAAPAVPTVQFTPAGAQYAIGQTMRAQAVGVSHDLGTVTLQLASHNGTIASVEQVVTVAGTTPTAFAVTGHALGTVRLQGTSSAAGIGTTDVTIVSAKLRADGWAGAALASNDYRRIRIYAGGTDGAATDAVFATATTFTVTFDDRYLEVHLDAVPSKPVGPADGADRAGSRASGETVSVAAGQAYVSLLVRGKNPGTATLSLAGPTGSYVPLTLTGLTIQ